jgi:hypothetical protein
MSDSDDAPARPRPRWLTLLTLLMLLGGGRLLITSLGDLHRLVTQRAVVLTLDGSLEAQQEAYLRAQVVLDNALSHHRPVSLAAYSVARLALGLLYLFAVAAVFSGDRRARWVAIVAGWGGILLSGASALFLILVVRGVLPWLEPMLAAAYAEDAVRTGRAAVAPAGVGEQARVFLLHVPLLVAAVGVLWSLILIAYFRGRRVRLFYNG